MAEKKPSPLDHATKLDALGWNVLPAPLKGKLPSVTWQKYQQERTSDKLRLWFSGKPRNYFVVCGRVSMLCVIDLDSPGAERWWRERLGDEVLDATCCVKTAKGHHYYFRLGDDDYAMGRSHHRDGIDWDFRCEGGGVIVPPSVHESGHVYEWLRGPEMLQAAPELLLRPGKESSAQDAPPTRSLLAKLLSEPPVGQDSGRNNWLIRVAGHYAKQFTHMRDAYEIHCRQAFDQLDHAGFSDEEYQKTIESAWRSEQRKGHDEGDEPSEDNGWLVSAGHQLVCQVRTKKGESEYELGLSSWADFDIRAVGVMEDEEAARTYDVVVLRRRHEDERRGMLRASDLADSRKLRAWLAEFGVSVIPPDNMYPRAGGVPERLTRYIEAQKPPQFRAVQSLGWHHDAFITHEGFIRHDGFHAHEAVRPEPLLRNWAPYRYGFVDSKLATSVLREVLTFHDETVTAVFGSWWVACLLKPQIHRRVSQFPFMAMEAPSESGKSTGFFPLMMQLAGNTQGQVKPTAAAFRDFVSAHHSGIVWVDDVDDPQLLYELFRQATNEGSVAKKGEDRTSQAVVRLVAPLCISGEALVMHGQKALLDRSVRLAVPSPVGRRSVRDPDQLQWQDILALRAKHPDLTEMAGTIVQMVLHRADMVDDIRSLVPMGGRFGDKIAVVRLGARILADICSDKDLIERVDEWAAVQENLGSENSLTLRLLPAALRANNWATRPAKAEGRWPATPAFIQDDIVWFSAVALAAWWREMEHGRISERTESEDALLDQARALGLGGEQRRRFNLSGDRNSKTTYWPLSTELSRFVIIRSRGEQETTPRVSQGVSPEQHRLELFASVSRELAHEDQE